MMMTAPSTPFQSHMDCSWDVASTVDTGNIMAFQGDQFADDLGWQILSNGAAVIGLDGGSFGGQDIQGYTSPSSSVKEMFGRGGDLQWLSHSYPSFLPLSHQWSATIDHAKHLNRSTSGGAFGRAKKAGSQRSSHLLTAPKKINTPRMSPQLPNPSDSHPFSCAVCSRNFRKKSTLTRHLRESHGHSSEAVTLFPCPYEDCTRREQGFARKENVREHLRRCHDRGSPTVPPKADPEHSNESLLSEPLHQDNPNSAWQEQCCIESSASSGRSIKTESEVLAKDRKKRQRQSLTNGLSELIGKLEKFDIQLETIEIQRENVKMQREDTKIQVEAFRVVLASLGSE